jgi:hypothetical protein
MLEFKVFEKSSRNNIFNLFDQSLTLDKTPPHITPAQVSLTSPTQTKPLIPFKKSRLFILNPYFKTINSGDVIIARMRVEIIVSAFCFSSLRVIVII